MITLNTCSCPPGESLIDIPVSECPTSMGQIQKLMFVRTGRKTPLFTAEKAPEKLASWTPHLTASDDTKVVITPYVENPELVGGEPLTVGGGNASLNGAEKVIGTGAANFTGVFNECDQSTIKAMKMLRCENLAVAFITQDGRIWMQAGADKKSFDFTPIVFRTMHVGDLSGGKLDDVSNNSVQFSLPAGYSDNLVPIAGDFNALTDLSK